LFQGFLCDRIQIRWFQQELGLVLFLVSHTGIKRLLNRQMVHCIRHDEVVVGCH
jgi:hypothetical protein